MGSFGKLVQRAFDRFDQVKVDQLKGEFAGFDFRKVQDIIQDRQQSVRTGANGFGKLTLLRGKIAIEQEAGHANDTVHRRPNLMAHVREELALCAVCRFGGQLGVLQFHFGTFALGDVDHHCANRLWFRLLSHEGKVRNLPVTEFAWDSVCLSAQFEIQKGLARSEHLLVKGFENVSQMRHNFANGFAIVITFPV